MAFAQRSPDDSLMGDWKGTLRLEDGTEEILYAQVVDLDEGRYMARFLSETFERVDPYVILHGSTEDSEVIFKPAISFGSPAILRAEEEGVLVKSSVWSATMNESVLAGTVEGAVDAAFELTPRAYTPPPTMGLAPPDGAVVLFDGSSLDAWSFPNPKPDRTDAREWALLEGGILENIPGVGSMVSKQSFTDFKMHIEFRLPFEPHHRGQKRANSGVYLLGRYEVQILDSYGLDGKNDECGAFYLIAPPDVNMCAPPGEWQTYDITFRAPRFNANGRKISQPVITVLHNGVPIHTERRVWGTTRGAIDVVEKPTGPIMIQDHSNPVQFRNIWIQPLP